MYLTEKSSKTYFIYHTIFNSLVLKGSKTPYKTKRINFSVSGFFKAYWKYYNLYDVHITHPNQTVYTNMGRSEKTRF